MQVNIVKGQVYIFTNICITLVTLFVNLWAAAVIQRKERTRIHTIIVYDCAVNVLSSLHTAFFQSDMQNTLIFIYAQCTLFALEIYQKTA